MRFSHRKRLDPITGINMTPIVDITFQLLIAFLLIAPTLKHGINLALPKATAEKISQQKPLTVYITKDKWIYLNNQHFELDVLKEMLQSKYQNDPLITVYIEADGSLPYDFVVKVIAIVKEIGIERVGLVTEPQRQ